MPSSSTARVSIVVDSGQFDVRFKIFQQSMKEKSPINRKLSIQLLGWVLRNFQASGALQTPPWVPLKESTLKQKQRLGYSSQPLIRTGHLRQSFANFYDDTQAGVGARASFGVDYAAVHQEGSDDGRIPARPMLPTKEYAKQQALVIYGIEINTLRDASGL